MQEIIRYSFILDIFYCYSSSKSVVENPHDQEQRQQNYPLYTFSCILAARASRFFYKCSEAAILFIV